MKPTVILGLSGGVDSAVAARLLREMGHRVHGLYLDIGLPGGREEAEAAAESLGIPLAVRDIRAELEERVCEPFAAAYCRGETPNPCILCNPTVKFRALLELADELGALRVATGHYAAVREGALYKGRPENDQSYMLCRLERRQIERLLLPLGDYTKVQVRAMAAAFGLPVAGKPDSMEICFIPDGDYAAWLERRGCGCPPGDLLDEAGQVIGRHRGIHRYTIGQRRGLGFAAGRRVFVSDIDPMRNTVTLSSGDGLWVSEAFAGEVNWLGSPPEGAFRAMVKIRHSRVETPALVVPTETGVQLRFETPVRAPVPGQSAVGYLGERLVFGGVLRAVKMQ